MSTWGTSAAAIVVGESVAAGVMPVTGPAVPLVARAVAAHRAAVRPVPDLERHGARRGPADKPDTRAPASTARTAAPGGLGGLGDLVGAARAGDADATEGLLGVVLQIAHRYARARLGTYPAAAEVAADVAQEVGIGVLTALPTYDDRGAPFEAFVYRLASRKVADAQRAHARGPVPADHVASGLFDGHVASAETRVVERDEASRAWALLETLSDRHREVIVLRVGVGLSAAETADALGMTPGGVRVAQHRALGELRARWVELAS